jgi:hypothetical protein
MSEEQGGFFGQIKNQIITTVGLIITAAGGLVVTNMEAIFGVGEDADQPMMEQTINLPEASTDTIVITKKIEVVPTPAPEPEKTETEKRKEDFDW